jgi:hypothetical protein
LNVRFYVGQSGPDSCDEVSKAISAQVGLYGPTDVFASTDKKDTKAAGRLLNAFFYRFNTSDDGPADEERLSFDPI